VTTEAEKPPAAETGPSGTGEPCCRLDFAASPVKGGRYRLRIIEHDCGYHHGARAYFDGVYRKVG
jgi:hypothetical protein